MFAEGLSGFLAFERIQHLWHFQLFRGGSTMNFWELATSCKPAPSYGHLTLESLSDRRQPKVESAVDRIDVLEDNRAPEASFAVSPRQPPDRTSRCPSLSRAYPTHTLLSSSFWGLPYRILNINHKKELVRSLWVGSCRPPPGRPPRPSA